MSKWERRALFAAGITLLLGICAGCVELTVPHSHVTVVVHEP